MENAKEVILEVAKKFKEISGREYGLFEEYKTKDADYIMLIMGSAAGTAKELFIHVNSVKYRLQQIYNILQIQLNTSYDWLQIQLAAILYRYLLNNK